MAYSSNAEPVAFMRKIGQDMLEAWLENQEETDPQEVIETLKAGKAAILGSLTGHIDATIDVYRLTDAEASAAGIDTGVGSPPAIDPDFETETERAERLALIEAYSEDPSDHPDDDEEDQDEDQ